MSKTEKVVLTLSSEIAEGIKLQAQANERTIQGEIRYICKQALDGRERSEDMERILNEQQPAER